MIAALLLLAATGDPVATLTISPAEVEVGEPFTVALSVEHDAGVGLDLPDLAQALGDSWIVYSAGEARVAPSPDGAQRATTSARWELGSLEPGVRELPALEVLAGSVPATSGPVTLRVDGVLAEGEDAPRPLPAFRPPPPWSEPGTPRPWWVYALAGVALGALLTAVVALVQRRRRTPEAPPARPPLDRVRALAANLPSDAEALRTAHFELAALVRAGVDERLGRSAAARVDEEWLTGLAQDLAAGGVEPALADEAAALLERCTAARWAGLAPSSYAARETFEGARELLERLGPRRNGAGVAG